MYVLGVLKSPFMTPVKQIGATDTLDHMNYVRFVMNAMSPEETLALFNPQIVSIADYTRSEQNFPQVILTSIICQLESLERGQIRQDSIYLCFNGLCIYLWVGSQCDPYFIQEIFKTNDFSHIDKQISEEEMFAGYD